MAESQGNLPPKQEEEKFNKTAILALECPKGKDKQSFITDPTMPWLKVRLTSGGSKSYVFESRLHGATKRITLGDVNVWSVKDARKKAVEFKQMCDNGINPRTLELEKQEQVQRARAEKERVKKYTVMALLSHYADELEAEGSNDHEKVRGMFRLHVEKAFPAIATKAANALTTGEAADLIRRLYERGNERTAGKLRSYAHAAYERASTVEKNGTVKEIYKHFAVAQNPFTKIKSIALKTDKNPLSLPDLRKYWAAIKHDPTYQAAVLRFLLLTGGQRIEQMCKLKSVDVHDNYFVIYERKGRGQKAPMHHIVPLIPPAVQALKDVRSISPYRLSSKVMDDAGEPGTYIFTTDDGSTHISAGAISKWSKSFGLEIEGHQAKRLRSGTETLLASQRFSDEERGRLMSHGVSGVQNSSYNAWDYMNEKREALEALYETLEATDVPVP